MFLDKIVSCDPEFILDGAPVIRISEKIKGVYHVRSDSISAERR